MIIVEGPDGAGKSKTVEYLKQRFDIPIEDKVVGPDTVPLFTDLKQWTDSNLRKGCQRKIFDRHRLISEPIYAAAMNREVGHGFNDINWLTGKFLQFYAMKPLIIYCLPPFEKVKFNVESDPENEVVRPNIEYIYNLYVAKAADDISKSLAMKHDYTEDPALERVDMMTRRWLTAKRYMEKVQ